MRVSVSQRSLIWLGRPAPGSAGAYAIAIFLVVIAGLIRWGLSFVSEDIFLFAANCPVLYKHIQDPDRKVQAQEI